MRVCCCSGGSHDIDDKKAASGEKVIVVVVKPEAARERGRCGFHWCLFRTTVEIEGLSVCPSTLNWFSSVLTCVGYNLTLLFISLFTVPRGK